MTKRRGTWRSLLRCPRQHLYSARSPLGRSTNITKCPICNIDDVIKTLRILRKWIKQVD